MSILIINGFIGNSIDFFYLHNHGVLFVIGRLFTVAPFRTIRSIKEDGEINKNLAVGEMRVVFKQNLKHALTKEGLLGFLFSPINYPML